MLRIFTPFCFTFLINLTLFSQIKTRHQIQLDTINIYGILTTGDGRPVPYHVVRSKAPDSHLLNYKLTTFTDSLGRFKLLGALFNDTLTVDGSPLIHADTILNRGSRFIQYNLKKVAQAETAVISITARRKSEKTKLIKYNLQLGDKDALHCFSIDVPPSYIGGATRFVEFLNLNVKYPLQAIQENRQGMVIIKFDVLKNGALSNYNIIQGIGLGCEEAVINALKCCKNWLPGINDGRPVITQQSVSFIFKLTD